MDLTTISCGCQNNAVEEISSVTVPAGSVSGGLSVCGFDTDIGTLPKISFQNQDYTEGFCPNSALTYGTMFPELSDVYK